MYFNDRFCNPQYVNPYYYLQQQEYIRQMKQDLEVQKAAKAARDLCRAVKNMDEQHQQHAFLACLCVMAEEYGWGTTAI